MEISESLTLLQETTELILPYLDSPQTLSRSLHSAFLSRHLTRPLSSGYAALDASKPWIIYWCLHGLDLLESPVDSRTRDGLIQQLIQCQHPDGGFGGGLGQQAHLATTYAAVNSLAILRSPSSINRHALASFLSRLKSPSGSFRMTETGETDVRASYCVISVATLTNLLSPELTHNVPEFIAACQSSLDGGFAALPGAEAHGGYTYCAVSALVLLDALHHIDLDKLALWVCSMQHSSLGGFAGRVGKLVDGCYSFWVGATGTIVESKVGSEFLARDALHRYVLYCCQSEKGGLRDKPEKYADMYHSCYCLSGLSITQHKYTLAPNVFGKYIVQEQEMGDDIVKPTHPLFNIGFDHAQAIIENFM